MNKHFFGDTAVLLGRTLRHITRSPDTIITVSIMPIALMLLFRYVLGGAINTGLGPGHYVNYLLPGILLITIATGISYTTLRLFMDLQTGIFGRFQSLPIARSSVLWAHVATSVVSTLISLVIVVLVALPMGFRSGAGVLAWLAVAGIVVLLTLALTWVAVIAGDGEEDVFEGRLLLDIFDLGGREELLQLGEGSVRDDPPLVEDRDPVGELFGLVQVLRREQHRRAAPGQFPDGLPHLEAPLGVEPGRRLVEEDDRRISDQAHRDVEAAAHATRVRRHLPRGRVG